MPRGAHLLPLLLIAAQLAGALDGEECPGTSVAVLIPASPFLQYKLKEVMLENVRRLLDFNSRGPLCVRAFLDGGPMESLPEDARPLSKTSRLRNRLLDSLNISDWDYILWIDADVIEYPPDLPWLLIKDNPGGVTAPLVLIEEPGPEGPNQFYDTTAFTLKGRADFDMENTHPYVEGRSVNKLKPYIPVTNETGGESEHDQDLVDVDGVGTVYILPASLFEDGSVRYVDHSRLTEHWSVVSKAHERGLSVKLHQGVAVRHANLPNWGESWHDNQNKPH